MWQMQYRDPEPIRTSIEMFATGSRTLQTFNGHPTKVLKLTSLRSWREEQWNKYMNVCGTFRIHFRLRQCKNDQNQSRFDRVTINMDCPFYGPSQNV